MLRDFGDTPHWCVALSANERLFKFVYESFHNTKQIFLKSIYSQAICGFVRFEAACVRNFRPFLHWKQKHRLTLSNFYNYQARFLVSTIYRTTRGSKNNGSRNKSNLVNSPAMTMDIFLVTPFTSRDIACYSCKLPLLLSSFIRSSKLTFEWKVLSGSVSQIKKYCDFSRTKISWTEHIMRQSHNRGKRAEPSRNRGLRTKPPNLFPD